MAGRSDVVVDAKDLAVDANTMLVLLKHLLNLLEKQVKMLKELAEAHQVMHGTGVSGDRQEEADFIMVQQHRMREIVELMTRQIKTMRSCVETNLAMATQTKED